MKQLLKLYEQRLGNLEYNYKTNSKFWDATYKAIVKQRIEDFKEFIENLKKFA